MLGMCELVYGIELHNRNMVIEERRIENLYQRLETAIDRSRKTYEKRLAHAAAQLRLPS